MWKTVAGGVKAMKEKDHWKVDLTIPKRNSKKKRR